MFKALIVAIMLLFASPVFAGDSREWTTTDTAYQAAIATVSTVDYLQTRYISKHPDQFYEMNPLMGSKHPSIGRVNTFFIVGTTAQAAISYILPQPYRRYWQCVVLSFRTGIVAHNASIGIKLQF